ncbi:MAG: CvpA family protein [Clostridia bacterium]|nr:CvpA family protein [Clostridia bacterium]
MNWLDLGIVIFVIIFIVVGVKKGLMSSVLSNFSLSTNCLISAFLHKPIAFIYNKIFKLGPAIFNHFDEVFTSKSANLATNLLSVPKENLKEVVKMAINDGNFGFVQKTMFKVFINKKNLHETLIDKYGATGERTVADIIAQTYSSFFVTIIAFVTSLILLYAIVWTFTKFAEKLRENGSVKIVDNSLGAIYGIFSCFIALIVICLVINLLSPFNFMDSVINYINGSFFGRFLYRIINEFMNNYLSFSDIISSIFN